MPTPWDFLRTIIDGQQYREPAPVEDIDYIPLQQSNMDIITNPFPNLGGNMPNDPQAMQLSVQTTGQPKTRVTMRGQGGKAIATTKRTQAMIRYAEKLSGLPIQPNLSQGGYQDRNTHRGDALDISVQYGRRYTDAERVKVVHALKDAGFAAYYRPNFGGNPDNDHIHAIPIGGDIDSDAAWQVQQYDARRNALTNNARDTTYRPAYKVIFDYVKGLATRRK